MTVTMRSRIAWGVAIASTILVAFAAIVPEDPTGDILLIATVVLATAAFGLVGAIITARTGNAVGWALLATVGVMSVALAAEGYATFSLQHDAPPLPGTTFAAWVGTWVFFLGLALIVSILLLFPTGRPLWRWAWHVYRIATALVAISWAVLPQELGTLDSNVQGPQNPYALTSLAGPLGAIVGVASVTILICGAIGIAGLVVRFRRARADEREQIKWLAVVGVAAAAGFALNILLGAAFGDHPNPGLPTILSDAAFIVFIWIVLFGIPLACGIAILKYRLWDIDVVIKKTLVALVLAILLGAISLGAAAIAGQAALSERTPRLVAIAVGVVLGALLLPLLRLSRRIADRLVYGKRATPYEVLSTFASRVGETYASDDVLPRMAQILQAGSGAGSARVLIRVGATLLEAAHAGVSQGDEHVQPIVFQGEEVGALAVTFPANDPIDPQRAQLVENLAAQAGPVVRNVRLLEELRASRQRLVAAQDEERRKIERNLHDGVQQQLVALNVQAGLLARVGNGDPSKLAEMAEQLQTRATEALDDLRDLARGIYPPLLADKGLGAALEAQARKSVVPVSVETNGIGRYEQPVEAAVYFCTLEALNNVAKYARASNARVTIGQNDGHLRFTVTDDGAGFDTATTGYGTGLQGMADRLDSIGGTLRITSTPGAGTSVSGIVPVA
jgi:signal transduction histidine kinase